VEHKNDAQGRRDAEYRLMQQMVLLGARRLPSGPTAASSSNLPNSSSSGINSSSDRTFAGAWAGLRRMRQQRFLVTV